MLGEKVIDDLCLKYKLTIELNLLSYIIKWEIRFLDYLNEQVILTNKTVCQLNKIFSIETFI